VLIPPVFYFCHVFLTFFNVLLFFERFFTSVLKTAIHVNVSRRLFVVRVLSNAIDLGDILIQFSLSFVRWRLYQVHFHSDAFEHNRAR